MNDDASHSDPVNAANVERLFNNYRSDPDSVPMEWRAIFDRFNDDRHANPATTRDIVTSDIGFVASKDASQSAVLQDRVDQLVRAYRVRGHMIAQIDPLNFPRPSSPELDPAHYGLTEADMDRQVSSRTIAGPGVRTLRDLLRRMRNTYCRSIGAQFMHIDDLPTRHWLQERMEGTENRLELTRRQQFRIFTSLTKAVTFEELLQKKFVGAKTFSLEGCESLIPLIDLAIDRAAEHGIREIVIAMAHRGRLNVLANIMGKRPADIFREFEPRDPAAYAGTGDVKHHLGHSTDWESADGRLVHLSLCFNPSHLEFINPVAQGRMRAKQDRAGDVRRKTGMLLLIHGDASIAGEGIVQETLNLSELQGYSVGGALHVVVNSQIGFTTSPAEARSSLYATDVAKILQSPILHVNGEDPEAVAQVIRLAMDFRMEFQRDIVVDMYGYRKHGHNEMDEPAYTQPVLYRAIRMRKPVREAYLDHLLKLGKITRDEADSVADMFHQALEKDLAEARGQSYVSPDTQLTGIWSGYHGGSEPTDEVSTGVEKERLVGMMRQMLSVPPGFHRHPRLERFVNKREQMIAGESPLDWSAAETLALASLATEGTRIRLSGQDSARGTFSHRHAVLHDQENGETYVPLQHLAIGQAPVEIHNSPLSEASVVGFEYGYSLDCPDGLVMWEAQFGDFVNAAQVLIDQFIVSGEDKWRRLSGLVLLLPHGFDGQGPEHSSAYIERFLTLAAEDNIQIVQPSTPAQLFHLLRRQVLRSWRKPLVVFTPKSLLRHPAAVSSLDEFVDGHFQRVISDRDRDPSNVKKILLCGGQLYYDLAATRERTKRDDVAIVRIEQFYPWRMEDLDAALSRYPDGTRAYWVQDEPRNLGAWSYLRVRLGERLLGRFPFSGISRPESASPATGTSASHKYEQRLLIQEAFGAADDRDD